jgi:RNA recognition motif-containing protein
MFFNKMEVIMNIYIGNLSRDITEEDLGQAFEAFGKVSAVAIIKDKFSGESRGFGFVEMPAKGEAQAAIAGLNGKELKGRILNVNEARPRSEDRRSGGRKLGSGRYGDGYRGGRGKDDRRESTRRSPGRGGR